MFLVGFLFQVELPKCSLFFPSMHLNGVWFPIYFKSTRSNCCFTPRQRFVPISGAVGAKKKNKNRQTVQTAHSQLEESVDLMLFRRNNLCNQCAQFLPASCWLVVSCFCGPLSTDPVLRRVEMLIITKQLIWMQFRLLAIVFPFLSLVTINV